MREMNGPFKIITLMFALALLAAPAAAMLSAAEPEEPPDPNAFVSYYAQLDANGKAIYDALDSADPDINSLTIVLPIIVTATADDPNDAKEYVLAMVKKSVDDAFIALRLSSPRAYLGWFPTSCTYADPVTLSGSTATIASITIDIHYKNYPDTFQSIEKMLEELDAEIEKFSTNGKNDAEKVSDINRYLIDKVTYDPNYGKRDASNKRLESPYSHDAYGALVNPNHAVCDGYSKAFLLLCQKEGIDCVVALGTSISDGGRHAWNYVKVDDKWYAIDVTWNDTSNNEYFLLGTSFFTTHLQGIYLDTGVRSDPFSIPAISTSSFGTGQQPWWMDYAWVLAIAIVALILVALYMFSKRGRPTR